MLVTPTGISKGCGYVAVSCFILFLHLSDLDVLSGSSNLEVRRTRNVLFASYRNSRFLADLYLFERFVLDLAYFSAMLMRHSGPRK